MTTITKTALATPDPEPDPATQRRSVTADQPYRQVVCLACGIGGDGELHHVAGERNHATLTIPVCLTCHGILSRWQQSAGIYLEQGPRHPVDVARAAVVGFTHAVELFVLYQPGMSAIANAVRRAGWLASAAWDSGADPARLNRWTPDPAVVLPLPEPRPEPASASVVLDGWTRLMDQVTVLLNATDPGSILGQAVAHYSPSLRLAEELGQDLATLHDLVEAVTHGMLYHYPRVESDEDAARWVWATSLGITLRSLPPFTTDPEPGR